jgi:hypothetical protein
MARKAKFKPNEEVTYFAYTGGCTLFIDSKGQYIYRNNPVVNLRNAAGDLIAKAISIAHVSRLPESVPQSTSNSVLCGNATQAASLKSAAGFEPIKTVTETLDERGNRYGDFSDHARLAQQLQDVMRNHSVQVDGSNYDPEEPWRGLSAVQKQALTVIADKIARILNGDPNYVDNWHDIQGYAKLVEDRLPKAE